MRVRCLLAAHRTDPGDRSWLGCTTLASLSPFVCRPALLGAWPEEQPAQREKAGPCAGLAAGRALRRTGVAVCDLPSAVCLRALQASVAPKHSPQRADLASNKRLQPGVETADRVLEPRRRRARFADLETRRPRSAGTRSDSSSDKQYSARERSVLRVRGRCRCEWPRRHVERWHGGQQVRSRTALTAAAMHLSVPCCQFVRADRAPPTHTHTV